MGRYRLPYTLTKRGKYWYYRTYDPRGVRTTAKSTGCTKKADAHAYCDKLYLSGGLYNSNVLFKDYASHFYDDDSSYVKDRTQPLSENTIIGYRIRMEQNIMPFFEKYKMGDIKYTHLKMFRVYLIDKGYAPSVVAATISCLKHIFDTAYRDGLISTNPYTYLESLSIPNNERDAFTVDEVKIIYESIDKEFKEQILLMALTGMRISESQGVTKDDIIHTDNYSYINLTKQFNKKKYKPLKGKYARPIPIIPEMEHLIHEDRFDDTRLPAFYKAFQPVKNNIERHEERRLSFHSLRHFFITNAKSYGIVESKVERIAGHSLKGISKVYTNYGVEDLLDILEWQRETLKKMDISLLST